MFIRLIWVWLLLFCYPVYAQQSSEFTKLIIATEQKKFSVINETVGQYGSLAVLDEQFGLYTLITPTHKLAENMLKIRSISSVRFVQLHHEISRRYNSNDPLIANQKYLNVTRCFQAWDYGRGGVSRGGDTIVVAVIDDGVDTLHPDLVQNLWFNYAEIPLNGIDDDANGYTDDYRGWNGGDSNHRIFTSQSLSGHGTAVAGVIGARGDNSLGISGVNWSVKLMPIICYSTNGLGGEEGVIRSMLYALRMKKLYQKSGGAKGANIVAVNMSVGIDLATPDEAPIWCALYDSLGAAGIISVAATTNLNINVDNQGDIPSTCVSKYLIVVSNTDQNDQRVNSGYGMVSVDLAAPGQNVYTTALKSYNGPNGPYIEESGTSFASPQVAGSVALMHNTVCETWLSILKSNPDSAIALMNGWILGGVDKLMGLQGKCKTEGRLNTLHAWIQMDNWCKMNDIAYSVNAIEKTQFVLFPNPANSGQLLHTEVVYNNNMKIELISADGKIMNLGSLHDLNGKLNLQLPSISAGIYTIKITDSGKTMLQKLSVY